MLHQAHCLCTPPCLAECTFDRPLLLAATVVHGFKRGSKELGIPTANLSMDELAVDKADMDPGIYFGFARLDGKTYDTVVSVGWNPYYKNTVKTIEAHLLASMEDFYGQRLEVLICGFLRQEQNFTGLGTSHILYIYLYSLELIVFYF